MPLNEALLQPVPGSNPSGENLRYSPLYEKIKEARREEDSAPAGVWEHEVKRADYPLVIKLAQEALTAQTKDLQLAAWLAEALLKKQGFAGLRDGLALCQGLVEKFWDTVYPLAEDGDLELRAAPLEWLGTRLDLAIESVPLNKEGHGFIQYQESRKVGYEDQAKSADQKKAREAALKENKLAPEVFDKAFTETSKAFYSQAEKDLDACLAGAGTIEKLCDEKFGADNAPSFRDLRKALEEVRRVVHSLLEKKRETEPDPVEVAPAGDDAAATSAGQGGAAAAVPTASILISVASSSEPEDRREAVGSVARAAAFLRQREPLSPAPYLMLRGLRWGELRAAVGASDPTKLEAPPTELRQHIKRLELDQNWKQLLEVAENAMALPSSRAWLDLQRCVIEACVGLGSDYEPIAKAIRSELKTLLQDLPDLAGATLMDDTPAANSQTQAWLKQLLAEPATPADGSTPPQAATTPPAASNDRAAPGWQKRFVDSYVLAKEALRAGQPDKALDIMQQEIARQPSGRGRFLRKLQMVELCVSAGKDAIAQPMLDDLAAAVDAYKLEDWEDHELVAQALATIMKLSKRIQGDAKLKQQMFDRICRLSPVQALTSG